MKNCIVLGLLLSLISCGKDGVSYTPNIKIPDIKIPDQHIETCKEIETGSDVWDIQRTELCTYDIGRYHTKEYRYNDIDDTLEYLRIKHYLITYIGDVLDNNDEPAVITYDGNGIMLSISYYKNGKTHRDGDEPAAITYNIYGKITSASYIKNGKNHRDGGLPSYIKYKYTDLDEKYIRMVMYMLDGEFHRENDLPIQILFNEDGEGVNCWFDNGRGYWYLTMCDGYLLEDELFTQNN